MPEIKFESKEDLTLFCQNRCSYIENLYKQNIDCIRDHGAAIKIRYKFYCKDKCTKPSDLDLGKRSSLVICVSVYPAKYSEDYADRSYVHPSYYSKIGRIKRIDSSTYQLNINERKDRGLTMFFKRYANRLVNAPVEIALKQRLSDFFMNAIIIKRMGSTFNKTYRGFSICLAWIIVLLFVLLVLRVLIPTGYHPSLK